ncbi:hypothetical protein ACQJBY_050524 [Aegilops geniculata]
MPPLGRFLAGGGDHRMYVEYAGAGSALRPWRAGGGRGRCCGQGQDATLPLRSCAALDGSVARSTSCAWRGQGQAASVGEQACSMSPSCIKAAA